MKRWASQAKKAKSGCCQFINFAKNFKLQNENSLLAVIGQLTYLTSQFIMNYNEKFNLWISLTDLLFLLKVQIITLATICTKSLMQKIN